MKKQIIGGKVQFTFDDGLESVVFDPATASAENRAHAEMHGWLARLGDMAAIPKSEENGFRVTEAMRREAIIAGTTHYTSGTAEWNLRGAAKTPKQNPAIVALAAALGKTYAEAEAHIANLALEAIAKGE